ncbi:b(o/a)3-type cytochrome-c oxidase subunit 1 [Anoxybacillus sp. LAT_35]|uniref:b(o/a)3-type cytochrome-c oxidase subunit 1 n=1 Tax=Anoxybacillus TaxID=150247 RepID=UPI001EDB1615|nr:MULTISPECIES: b(o/a)3-type cytochrome-c oxidase subunit 1 [Anoxybacillus]MCG5026549.1 b(o/a)3-type cytochrome-c oxidase subunit 1 [Anoxybacillus flavithermus]MCG6199297.1 b(o/a)3-type cytochrome-c oxidase subunit 1 [Anoxybacillus sp. LAT_38]MCG3083066.1 b(o/a)3-type cytochrome-c oxidase subunit 1 [Anoxybacillus sp. LAT27]MCG6171185.1 b(o/a)3-type cytochrome-c oxidase subunit 1 [Anoxybacillus sp. LAT_11]MCG6176296.1 b(o/a)3-type cytochrome-c oxidase subunit 1 [Anoxybacillus sp. LAT_31]
MINGTWKVDARDGKLAMAHIYVAFVALALGGLAGLLQVLVRSGKFELPAGISYYTILTTHGVLLGLVLTTFFIIGFQFAAVSRTAGTLSDRARFWGWVGFWLMTIGTAITAFYILIGEASVLYTFYAPLQAHAGFYIGLTLVVVGSWVSGFAMFAHYAKWKKAHPGQVSPLLTFMSVVNMVLWLVCSLGVAATVLFQLIPWSLGYVDRINVLVSRTLFWYFGHPLVYFWLLPAYMIWYAIIPKIIGGKMFSDSLARMSFILFLIFSIPVGFHHQLVEPGIDPAWKYLQVVLTFMVVIPSLMTAFSMFATFEMYGRSKGATGLFGWLRKLPWGDARFFAPFIGMLFFIPAGAGGLVNASHQLNQVVHNTIWVTGHFHLTLATTVVLTFFGAAYWLIPHLTGRVMTKAMNRLAIIQTIVWSIGMIFMSSAMHFAGLLGAPRRSAFSTYGDAPQALEWIPYQIAQAVGGTILFIGIILVLIIVTNLAFFAPKGETEFPVAEVAEQAERTPLVFENWKLWIGIAVVLILIAYTVPFIDMIQNAPPGSKGFKLW